MSEKGEKKTPPSLSPKAKDDVLKCPKYVLLTIIEE